jgi:hypothetical protein
MKLPDPEQFNFKDVTIAGDECLLITPDSIKCKWNAENERFRSIIIRKSDHKVISHGLKKFTNFFENPDFQPWNSEWKFEARHKYDGSCAIISKHNGELIFRTRGTASAYYHDNGNEIDFLIGKYPALFDSVYLLGEKYTIICEWVTPSRIICLREFDEPTLVLLGVVVNETGDYLSQAWVDMIARDWKMERPKRYEYNSISECIADVEAWVGREGVVLYSPDGNTLKKIKSSHYLSLHRLSFGIKNISNVLDVFMESSRFVESKDFYNYVVTTLDFEIAERVKDDITKITEAYGKFIHSVNTIERAMEYISKLDSRKKQAMAIQEHWDGWLIPCAFSLLDNKPLDDKLVKKSMEKLLGL